MKTFVATIETVALDDVKLKIAKLEKRIKSKVILTEGKPYWQAESFETGIGLGKYVMEVVVEVPEIECVAPGYRVIGMVDFRKTLKGENGLVYVFDENYTKVLENYRCRESAHCDHCHTNRFRNIIYVLINEATGKIISVGRNCLKDFLHIDTDPMRLFESASDAIEDIASIDMGIYASNQKWFPVDVILSLADYAIKKYGYVNRTKAIELGTSATPVRVYDYLRGTAEEMPPKDCLDNKEEIKKWFDENASKVFDDSSFGANVKTLLNQDAVRYESFGFLSYAVVAMNRYLDKQNRPNNGPVSQYVGKVKDKIEITLKVTGISTFATRFGESTLYRFMDENGNALVWFSSNDVAMEKGKTYKISAIVKEHNEYKGTKQTVLARCKILSKIEEEPIVPTVDKNAADKAFDEFLAQCEAEE